jgi:hypothetical protein
MQSMELMQSFSCGVVEVETSTPQRCEFLSLSIAHRPSASLSRSLSFIAQIRIDAGIALPPMQRLAKRYSQPWQSFLNRQ